MKCLIRAGVETLKNVLGVINLFNENEQLEKLTLNRPLASVPFGGRYRLIDFTLSNLMNSNVKNVAILMNQKYRSLMDHLGNGKEWDLNRKNGGLFLLPSFSTWDSDIVQTDLQNLFQHLEFFQKAKQDQLLVINGTLITNIDYRVAFQVHTKNDADITILYPEEKNSSLNQQASKNEMFFIKKSLFLQFIKENAFEKEIHSLSDVIYKFMDQYKVIPYFYPNEVIHVSSIKDYYQANMQLLDPDYFQKLISKPGKICSKEKDDAPVRYTSTSEVMNSLIANGCIIEGKVEGSIIFRGVKVHQGASIKNSIILQKCEIGENAVLENVILDKEVVISPNQILITKTDQPIVIEKGAIIQ